MRLIDADATIHALSVASRGDSKDVIRNLVICFLLASPTVDAEPVRHGKWLYIRTDEDENGVYECSECHAGEVHYPIVDVRYCWKCGARMDGAERKEE